MNALLWNRSSCYSPPSFRTLSEIKSGDIQRALRTRTKVLRTKSMILGSFTWNLKWVLPGDRQTKLPCLFSDGPGEWVQGASTRATCAVAVLSQNDPSVPPRTHADSYRLALVTTGAFLGNHSKTGKPPGDRRCHGESRQPCCHSRPPLPPHGARPARPWSRLSWKFSVQPHEGPWKFLNTFLPGCALQDQAKNQKAWPARPWRCEGPVEVQLLYVKDAEFLATLVGVPGPAHTGREAAATGPEQVTPCHALVSICPKGLREARLCLSERQPGEGAWSQEEWLRWSCEAWRGQDVGTSEMFSISEGLSHGKELQRASVCVYFRSVKKSFTENWWERPQGG